MASESIAPGPLTSEPDSKTSSLDFADSPPAEELIALPYARPFRDEPDDTVSLTASVALQVAHRAGSLALMLLLGGIGALIAAKHAGQLLFWTVGVATLGLLGASVAVLRLQRSSSTEARNVAIFNVVVFVIAMTLFLICR